ncbi:MAG: ATP-binding protein [Kiritimatiellae bacterium]|nr:ATP-binding protein [Kiritimatiellia bacterium]
MHASIADVIADTAQNSIEAGASRIGLSLVEDGGMISVAITDNGKGMDEATQRRAFDPFYTEPGKHDARKVGLGLPILKQICEECGGGFSLKSEKGVGTELRYRFRADHIDLPPMGSIPELVLGLFNYPGDFELVFSHRRGGAEYAISRTELAEAVGGLESVEGLSLAKEFLESQEESLKGDAE